LGGGVSVNKITAMTWASLKRHLYRQLLSVDELSCHRIGKIVTESSYRVAESSESFTESSRLVAESSCHRIGQLTNCPVSLWPMQCLVTPSTQ